MVKRIAPLLTVLVTVGLLAVGQQPAYARFHYNPNAQGGKYNSAPGTSDTPGGSGDPVHDVRGTCRLYASSSTYGQSCLGGGGLGSPPPIKVILAENLPKRKPDVKPVCWDTKISEDDWRKQYSADGTGYDPASPWYVETCLFNLNEDAPVTQQPGLQISITTVNIDGKAPHCIRPFKTPEEAQLAAQNLCVQELTHNQHTVVEGFDSQLHAEIPNINLKRFPSTHVRTNVPTAFQDAGEPAKNNQGDIQSEHISAGGYTMYAQMDPTTYTFDPGDGSAPIHCADAGAALKDGATPDNSPNSCWHTYLKSSNFQPGRQYTVVATVKWTVYVNGEPFVVGGHTATFTKTDTLHLEVDDVQTLVIGNS